MSKEETVEDKALDFDVMPGADRIDDDDMPNLDLSFDTVTEEPEAGEESAEVVAEDAEEETDTEDSEEAVAQDEADEPEAELDEVEEEKEGEESVTEAPKAKKKPMVPKARLDEVLAKQKALQKQLDEINAANVKAEEAPETYDFDAKEVEYQNMVLDGETDKAVALRREIRKAERADLEFEMRQEMSQTVHQDRQMTALQQAATAMEDAYPVFNRNSGEFSEEYTNEVVELRDMFMSGGDEAGDALSKAVKYVIKDHDLDQPQESAPSLAGSAQKSDELAKKRAIVNKKLRAAEAQPRTMRGDMGHEQKGLDIASMTEEEFDALPEATLRRLRGDII